MPKANLEKNALKPSSQLKVLYMTPKPKWRNLKINFQKKNVISYENKLLKYERC